MSSSVEMWAHHGGLGITSLLRGIAAGSGTAAVEAGEALKPRPDYAATARAAGWHYDADESEWRRTNDEASDGYDYANGADTACRVDGNVVLMLSDLEHVVVSEWLGERLERHGEKVVGIEGIKVWAKDAAVPALQHPVIFEIAKDYEPEEVASPGFR